MAPRNQTWTTPGKLWRKLAPQSVRMKKEPTAAEAALWEYVRKKQLNGVRFRRQHPLERFIVDFFAPNQRLIVEIDGPIHDRMKEQDQSRQAHLEKMGYRMIRFSNDEVINSIGTVLEKIIEALNQEI